MQDWVKRGLGWLITIVVVGVLVFFMGQITTLTCERANDRVHCTIESRFLGLVPIRERAVRDVTGAQVDDNCDEEGCSYRVELWTEVGMTPVTSFYSPGSLAKENMAKAVNAFLRDATAAPLRIREHIDPMSLIAPALVILGFFLWSRWKRHREGKHEQSVQQVADSQQAIEDDAG